MLLVQVATAGRCRYDSIVESCRDGLDLLIALEVESLSKCLGASSPKTLSFYVQREQSMIRMREKIAKYDSQKAEGKLQPRPRGKLEKIKDTHRTRAVNQDPKRPVFFNALLRMMSGAPQRRWRFLTQQQQRFSLSFRRVRRVVRNLRDPWRNPSLVVTRTY